MNFINNKAALAWLMVSLLALGVLTWLLPQSKINSSVLAMLPEQALGAVPADLNDAFLQRLDRQILWMVSPGKEANPNVAQYWVSQLQQIDALAYVRGEMTAVQQQEWMGFYWRHRNAMLDEGTRARLQGQGNEQIQWVLSQLYSAFAGVGGSEITSDPLLLTRSIQLSLAKNASQLQLKDGWLVAQDNDGNYWYLLHGETKGNSFDFKQIHTLVNTLAVSWNQVEQAFPNARLVSRGTVFYSDFASQQAKRDISTLGTATILGVILLIYWVFRSLRPLALVSLSVSIGGVFGTLVTLLAFGELHLMTLVMSMSVIGISVDYAIYYLTERMVHGRERDSKQSMQRVRNALLLALITTVISYLVLMLAPFPGIRQLAVFASTGLMAACFTVIFWFPLLVNGMPVRHLPWHKGLNAWLMLWRDSKAVRIGLPVSLLIISLMNLAVIKVDDDLSQLQSPPVALQEQERLITQLTGQGMDQKWFVVIGSNAQQTLENMENFATALVYAQQQNWLAKFNLLPVNSLARQQQDLQLIKQVEPKIISALAELGIDDIHLDTNTLPVNMEDWLSNPVSEGLRLMWVSLEDGRSGVLIPVAGVTNSAALGELANQYSNVYWVDRKQAFEQMFSSYRVMLSALLIVALLVVVISAVVRLGWHQGLRAFVPSVLSIGIALTVLSVSGQKVNLFSVLALILVLGIGINYTLFFSNKRGAPLTSLLAVSLAMLTTLLTLGMLLFSGTQAISNFGTILVSGIFTAFLLSPLALPKNFEVRHGS